LYNEYFYPQEDFTTLIIPKATNPKKERGLLACCPQVEILFAPLVGDFECNCGETDKCPKCKGTLNVCYEKGKQFAESESGKKIFEAFENSMPVQIFELF
jgi:hypothetical protein